MTIAEVLDALENALTRDMSWWDEAHGHTESFRIGTLNGLSTAVAKIILLRARLPPVMATDHNADSGFMASGDVMPTSCDWCGFLETRDDLPGVGVIDIMHGVSLIARVDGNTVQIIPDERVDIAAMLAQVFPSPSAAWRYLREQQQRQRQREG